MISGAATVAGVVGWPVAQSLSPLLHGAWIEALGLDAVYAPFAVRPDGIARWFDGLREGGVRGLNVTMPYKQAALAAADRASEAARRSGGANLLLFGDDDTITADTTDGRGVLAALAEQAPAWRAEAGPAVVFGAGGASGSIVDALLASGAPLVRVVARDVAKARALCAPLGGGVQVVDWGEAPRALADATLLLNATSLGFRGEGELEVDWSALPPAAVVMDAVMTPLETPLLLAARGRGHVVVDGLAMLIGQARPSFEAFYGVAPPVEVDVRALALAAIAAKEGAA